MKKQKTVTPPVHAEPEMRLSWLRVLMALVIIAGLVYGSVYGWQRHEEAQAVATHKPWFGAYVDVTSTPRFAFEQVNTPSQKNVVLAFIVSSKADACTPTWGNYYTFDEAAVSLDLDRRIARLQQQEGRVAISFGGAINDELALKCTDPQKLLAAYQSVLDRYSVDTIDLDLENTGLTDKEALKRRAEVIAQLQKNRRDAGKGLAVWLTLPVAPQGLTQAGTDAVAQMLQSGVDLAGVNVMTMDYGGSREKDQSMLDASKGALIETHRQLGILYKQAGINLNSGSLWRKIAATPMIGQNDVVEEVFTLDDAIGFNQFALEQGVGRLSIWSANRDQPCGENYVDTKVVSDSCSGVKSEKWSFTQALSKGLEGDLAQNSLIITNEDPINTAQLQDDPEKSPYQIWQEAGAYLAGAKVVWHGNVYEAKWWTRGDMPDNPVLQSWETPWKLVGPVLSGEKPIEQLTLPSKMYPEWSGTIEYQTGQRVLFEGVPFQAKWWNQGMSPAASAAQADSSPWLALTDSQIREILKTATSSAKKK